MKYLIAFSITTLTLTLAIDAGPQKEASSIKIRIQEQQIFEKTEAVGFLLMPFAEQSHETGLGARCYHLGNFANTIYELRNQIETYNTQEKKKRQVIEKIRPEFDVLLTHIRQVEGYCGLDIQNIPNAVKRGDEKGFAEVMLKIDKITFSIRDQLLKIF